MPTNAAAIWGPHKNVISSDEVAEVLREMGPVDGGASESTAQGAGSAPGVGAEPAANAGPGANAGRTYTADEYAEAVGESWAAGNGGAATSGATAGGAAADAAAAGAAWGAGATDGAAWGAAAAGGAPGPASGAAGAGAQPQAAVRRLYQIKDGAVISGVCKGLAAYLNIDVAVIRVLFVVLALVTGGAWILVYLVMMFVVPFAQTSEQHAAAHGWPFNAEEVIARAKSHYAAFKDSEKWRRQQSREQRRMWKDQRKQWRMSGGHGSAPVARRAFHRPPAAVSAATPSNATYSSQVVNGVVTPLVELLGALLFIAFLFALFSIATQHRVFGWGLPGTCRAGLASWS